MSRQSGAAAGFHLKTQQSASTQVSKLQAEQTFKAIEFNSLATRAPFALPKIAVVQTQPSLVKDCWQPSSRRKNGKLERFALTQLQLKGIMGSGNSVSGIIQVPTGQVVKVKKRTLPRAEQRQDHQDNT
jgi:type IV pilus assembly protein PilP